MPDIRRAHRGDAGPLAGIAEATFRATFGAMNTASDMDVHCRRSYGESIQAAEIARPDMVTLVSEDAGCLVGYAQLRWRGAPPCVAATSPGEIQRLYVVAAWHGRGLAQALMQACLDEMAQRGSDAVWLGVWERNARAIAFYGKFGFVEVGEHEFPLGGDLQRDIVMARPVAPGERVRVQGATP
jgi:diamine N-acetyltransferase